VSKNLSGPPLKYKQEEKLSLAVILAVQKLRHYILLHTKKVVGNSNPMQYFLSRRKVNDKFSRIILILQEYNLDFSTPKINKALILAELVTALPFDTTSTPVNTEFYNDPKPLCKDHHCFDVFLKLFLSEVFHQKLC
jgi:hypothetical protein